MSFEFLPAACVPELSCLIAMSYNVGLDVYILLFK